MQPRSWCMIQNGIRSLLDPPSMCLSKRTKHCGGSGLVSRLPCVHKLSCSLIIPYPPIYLGVVNFVHAPKTCVYSALTRLSPPSVTRFSVDSVFYNYNLCMLRRCYLVLKSTNLRNLTGRSLITMSSSAKKGIITLFM